MLCFLFVVVRCICVVAFVVSPRCMSCALCFYAHSWFCVLWFWAYMSTLACIVASMSALVVGVWLYANRFAVLLSLLFDIWCGRCMYAICRWLTLSLLSAVGCSIDYRVVYACACIHTR